MGTKVDIKEIIANRKKWAKGLRSGNYRQARYSFTANRRSLHCCLAVACDVLEPSEWLGDYYHANEERGGIDGRMRKRLGISFHDHDALIEMNGESSFDEIAYVVENLPLPRRG